MAAKVYKVYKIILIVLGCVSLFSGLAFFAETRIAGKYNKTFPEKYISSHYPDAEIVDSRAYEKDRMSSSNARTICYDKAENIYFAQEFTVGRSGKYVPTEENFDSRENVLRSRDVIERCSECGGLLHGEYSVLSDPLCRTDFFVIIKYDGSWEIYDLMAALNERVADEFRVKGGDYLHYRIVLCGENTYSRLITSDFFDKVQPESLGTFNSCKISSFAENTGMKAEQIEYNSGGGNEQLYAILRENCIGADLYDDIILWIEGEPNASGSQRYSFFGVNYTDGE